MALVAEVMRGRRRLFEALRRRLSLSRARDEGKRKWSIIISRIWAFLGALTPTSNIFLGLMALMWALVLLGAILQFADHLELRQAQLAVTKELVNAQEFRSSDHVLRWANEHQLVFVPADAGSRWVAEQYTRQAAIDSLHKRYTTLKEEERQLLAALVEEERQREQQELATKAKKLMGATLTWDRARGRVVALKELAEKVEDPILSKELEVRIIELEAVASEEEEAERKRQAEVERKAAKSWQAGDGRLVSADPRDVVLDTAGDGRFVLCAISREAFDELTKALGREDFYGLGMLILSGYVLEVPSGTDARLLDPGFAHSSVRISEGEFIGTKVWTYNELIHDR